MNDIQFTTRTAPWLKIPGVTEIDEAVCAEEAVHLAGLDFDVQVVQDGYKSPVTGNWKVDKTKRKIVRLDQDSVLGTVSPTYELLPYGEAFTFMDELNPLYVAGGALKNGRQMFLVSKLQQYGDLAALDGEDPHDLYTILRSSLDGSTPLEIFLLPLRNKCMNMMPLPGFGRDAKQRWSIRHTKNMRDKIHETQRVLTNLDGYAEGYKRVAEQLASTELALDEVRSVIEQSVPGYIKKPDEQVNAIMDVYQNSPANGYQGTAWGVMNAVTEFYDHFRGGDDRRPETRWTQGLDGSTVQAVHRTLKLLTN